MNEKIARGNRQSNVPVLFHVKRDLGAPRRRRDLLFENTMIFSPPAFGPLENRNASRRAAAKCNLAVAVVKNV
ncbi:hypothetical protein [Rhodoblastus sp.]|uniref:hypothetical protein n=1 Tax=Rhodoblastus sp. TaxID=1962975 RepID=UPI003F94BA1C